MKRQAFTATTAIEGIAPLMVEKYAHNSALRAGIDILRDYAQGGYWERVDGDKDATTTVVTFRHADGRTATVTVRRPTEVTS